MRRTVIRGLLLGLVACGGDADLAVQTRSGPTSFRARSALFQQRNGSLDGQSVQLLAMALYDIPLWCSPTDAGTPPDDFVAILLEVAKLGTAPVGPGDYSIREADGQPVEGATALYYSFVQGMPGRTLDVPGGSMHLSNVTDGSVEGDVDLTLEDGTVLGGSFSATTCRQ